MIVTMVAQLFCARVRHRLCPSEVVTDAERLTLEQVRRAADVFINVWDCPDGSSSRNTRRNSDESTIINVATPMQVITTARNGSPPIMRWESTPKGSRASTRNRRETVDQNIKLALPS
jgi:hypothetical protein